MENKTFTFLIISNRRGQTKSFTISSAWLKAAGVGVAVMFILLCTAAADYLGLLLEVGDNKRLKAENISLKRQFEVIESKVNSLENSLERVKNFSTKLKMITNTEDEDRSVKLALGPMPKPGQHFTDYGLPMEEREPASEFLQKEAMFMEKAPLDEARGELLNESQHNYATLSIRIDKAVRQTALREQGVLELWETLSERQSLLNATPSIKPARGWFTSRFGYRMDPFTGKPTMHYGLDIAAPPGTPVYAPADGMVSYVGYEAGYGKLVTIDHGWGLKSRFAHNSQVFVEIGQQVRRWDVISAVGNTGRSSGPHVHYEIRVHGVPVDPINYILEE